MYKHTDTGYLVAQKVFIVEGVLRIAVVLVCDVVELVTTCIYFDKQWLRPGAKAFVCDVLRQYTVRTSKMGFYYWCTAWAGGCIAGYSIQPGWNAVADLVSRPRRESLTTTTPE